MAAGLKIELDYEQQRLSQPMQSTLVGPMDWYPPAVDDDVWVEPLKGTAMLRPGPMFTNWVTTNSGIFAKLSRSDFTLDDSANWSDNNSDHGGPFMHYGSSSSGNPSGLTGIMTAALSANQGMCVEYLKIQSATPGPGIDFECGWSDTGDGTEGVSLRSYNSGDIEVWKSGVMAGQGSVSDQSQMQVPSGTGQIGQQNVDQYVRLLLIPWRDRELLVISTHGGGFSQVFEDLADNEGGLTITDAAKFWFRIPPNVYPADVRISKIQFASSGTAYGMPSGWRGTPVGMMQKHCYQDLTSVGAGLTTVDAGVPTWNPYSLANPVQATVAMTGGPSQTPFVYGARCWFPPVLESTVSGEGGPLDVIPWATKASLEVGDGPGGNHFRFSLCSPDEVDAAGAENIRYGLNRPVRISDEAGVFLPGQAEPPKYELGFGLEAGQDDAAREVHIHVRDVWKLAEEFEFADLVPLDGYTVADAYRLVCETIGIHCIVTSPGEAEDYVIPYACGGTVRPWNACPKPGDKGSEWLLKLHDVYAGLHFHGVGRSGELLLTKPSSMPSTPAVTLYRTAEEAVVAGGHAPSVAYLYVYKKGEVEAVEPEANDLHVVGKDYRTNRPIVLHKQDATGADPTLAPASRPVNWLGTVKSSSYGSPLLAGYEACANAMALLFPRFTAVRALIDFSCQYLPDFWQGDLVVLKGFYDGSDATVRVKTMSVQFVQAMDGGYHRPAHCVGEDSTLVCPLGAHGFTAKELGTGIRAARADRRRGHGLGDFLRSPGIVVEV